jgi:hypothetical protein
MEREFYHNEFEELIKEKADQYKMYPSDKVWKGIDRSLRSRRKWYWTGFVVLLSGISYIAITEILSPGTHRSITIQSAPKPTAAFPVTTAQLVPFSSDITSNTESSDADDIRTVVSDVTVEDSGTITASFDIPFQLFDATGIKDANSLHRGSLLIAGLEPLEKNEEYKIELSWPVPARSFLTPAQAYTAAAEGKKIVNAGKLNAIEEKNKVNWLQEGILFKIPPVTKAKRISWQLAFSPTVNYRKLTGSNQGKITSLSPSIPLAIEIDGDVNKIVNHKPALGFELGTHGMMPLTNRLTLKGGIQFNYSKYDIRAFKTVNELATISLNSSDGSTLNSLTSYTDLRNFGGSSVEELKNQYYQLSLPVGLEFRVFGNEGLQLNIAGTIQPTYLLNKNTYLITTDYKNYTKAPSLVRRWNMNAGAEAFISYNRGDVKWQIGPQFRYQLFSSYDKSYPIKEYLMEYGIKIGITKTIR